MNTEPTRNQIKRNPIREKTRHLLLRQPNFVSNSADPSFEIGALACEASALTTELTAPRHIVFSMQSKNQGYVLVQYISDTPSPLFYYPYRCTRELWWGKAVRPFKVAWVGFGRG